jgi:hypothetical protein
VPFTDAVEQAILNGFLQDPSWAGYSSVWVGLSSTTPTDSGGNVTEPSGNGYARVETDAADWGAAASTAPAAKANSAVVTFATATGNWVSGNDLTHFTLHDAASAGAVVGWGILGTAKPVLTDDTPSFPIGTLVLRLGKPADFP